MLFYFDDISVFTHLYKSVHSDIMLLNYLWLKETCSLHLPEWSGVKWEEKQGDKQNVKNGQLSLIQTLKVWPHFLK